MSFSRTRSWISEIPSNKKIDKGFAFPGNSDDGERDPANQPGIHRDRWVSIKLLCQHTCNRRRCELLMEPWWVTCTVWNYTGLYNRLSEQQASRGVQCYPRTQARPNLGLVARWTKIYHTSENTCNVPTSRFEEKKKIRQQEVLIVK